MPCGVQGYIVLDGVTDPKEWVIWPKHAHGSYSQGKSEYQCAKVNNDAHKKI